MIRFTKLTINPCGGFLFLKLAPNKCIGATIVEINIDNQMIKLLHFTYGFTYNGVRHAWYEKKLYRLPFTRKLKSYGLKVIKPCFVGSTVCYNVQREKITINRLKDITKQVDWSESVIISQETPF